jgi:predicted DsbA family dithiol-disulfide isomerase
LRIGACGDFVCLWCCIGKRRLQLALAQFPRTDEVEKGLQSFHLNSGAPIGHSRLKAAVLVERYGMTEARARELESETARAGAAEGLEYRFEGALSGNTCDARWLVHLARGAARLRVTGVPWILLERRNAISGAQFPTVFLGALTRAWKETRCHATPA